jgi:hypothetical protein
LFLLLLGWSIILGLGLAQAATPSLVAQNGAPPPDAPTINVPPNGTVDRVLPKYQFGQQTYLQTCATCHVGLPPAVMPSQTWADLLQDSQHYGVQVTPLMEPYLLSVWQYMSTYSRPIRRDETVPYRLKDSRYFKALHPTVDFTEPITVRSCVKCHAGAPQFDYRSLGPEWQNSP